MAFEWPFGHCLTACVVRPSAAQMIVPRRARARVNIAIESWIWQLKFSGERQISNGMASQLCCGCVCFWTRLDVEFVFAAGGVGLLATNQPYGYRHRAQGILVLLCSRKAEQKGACELTKSTHGNQVQRHSTRRILLAELSAASCNGLHR